MDHTHNPAVGYTLQLGRGHKPRHQHRALTTAQAASTHKTDSARSARTPTSAEERPTIVCKNLHAVTGDHETALRKVRSFCVETYGRHCGGRFVPLSCILQRELAGPMSRRCPDAVRRIEGLPKQAKDSFASSNLCRELSSEASIKTKLCMLRNRWAATLHTGATPCPSAYPYCTEPQGRRTSRVVNANANACSGGGRTTARNSLLALTHRGARHACAHG